MATATDKAVDIIRTKILDGSFAEGSHLKEEELVQLCGVSRTPVRDALRRLAKDRYVVNRPNQGTFVNRWTVRDIEHIFELRALLEGEAAHRAARYATPADLEGLRASINRLEALLKSDAFTVEAFLAENQAFHSLVQTAADSQPLSQALSGLVQPPIVRRTAITYDRMDLALSSRHHRELFEAITAGDGALAQAIMQTHILAAKHKFCHALRRTGQAAE